MSAIKPGQGSIKLSEVALDEDASLTVIASAKNTDATTVVQQLRSTIADALQKNALVVTSSGALTWDGTVLSLNNQNIQMRFLASENGAAYTHVMTASGVNGATTFSTLPIASGEILYVEYSRALANSNLVLENAVSGGSTAAGKTVKKGTTIPTLQSSASAAFQGTICVPVAINIGGALYWVGSGIVWGAGTTTLIGQTSSAGQAKDQNYLINGGFDYAQRNPGLDSTLAFMSTSTSYLGPDRWRFSTDISTPAVSLIRSSSYPDNRLSRFSAGFGPLGRTVTSDPVTATAATDRINLTAHGLVDGTGIKLTGLTGSGISTSLNYFVINSTANDFQLTTTPGGAITDITADGSGNLYRPLAGIVAMVQRIDADQSRSLIGKTVSLSFWYKSLTNAFTQPSKVKLIMNSAGSGYNDFSSLGVDFGPAQEQEIIPDGVWHQIKFENISIVPGGTFNGIEINLNFRDFVGIQSLLPGNFLVSQCMLNEGATASSFRAAASGDPTDEFAICQRYYQKSPPPTTVANPGSTFGGTITAGGNPNVRHYVPVRYHNVMRIAASILIHPVHTPTTGFASEVDSGGSFIGIITATVTSNAPGSFVLSATTGASGTGLGFHWEADAEL